MKLTQELERLCLGGCEKLPATTPWEIILVMLPSCDFVIPDVNSQKGSFKASLYNATVSVRLLVWKQSTTHKILFPSFSPNERTSVFAAEQERGS